jgi:hypothetical protein
MKLILKVIYVKTFLLYLLIIKWYFKVKILFRKPSVIYIIDIDNTIADTWPSLSSSQNEFMRYKNLPAFNKMINFLKAEMGNKEVFFLFLSARNPIYFFVSKKWLMKQGFRSFNLILVPEAFDKLNIIRSIPSDKWILMFDDLSYNHENGDVKFYSEIVSEIKTMKNVNYFDYEYLKQYQN